MPNPEKGSHHEVVLESRHLLGVFFLAVVLAAFFFSMGYFLGRSQAAAHRVAAPPPAKTSKDSGSPPTDLTFYERVESKPRAERRAEPQPAPAESWKFQVFRLPRVTADPAPRAQPHHPLPPSPLAAVLRELPHCRERGR